LSKAATFCHNLPPGMVLESVGPITAFDRQDSTAAVAEAPAAKADEAEPAAQPSKRKAKAAKAAQVPPDDEADEAPAQRVNTEEEEESPKAKAAPAATHDDLRAALRAYGKAHGLPKAAEVLKRVGGAAAVSEVPEDKIAAVIAALR